MNVQIPLSHAIYITLTSQQTSGYHNCAASYKYTYVCYTYISIVTIKICLPTFYGWWNPGLREISENKKLPWAGCWWKWKPDRQPFEKLFCLTHLILLHPSTVLPKSTNQFYGGNSALHRLCKGRLVLRFSLFFIHCLRLYVECTTVETFYES